MYIFLENKIAKNYDLGSKAFKIIKGKKVWFIVDNIKTYGFKNSKTHTRLSGRAIK
jgi:hypothetical protein